jgi:hypothetical protein
MNAVRTRERAVFLSYCRDLAERRFQQGFKADELCEALKELNRICVETLSKDEEAADVLPYLDQHITTTVVFGCDHVLDTYELLQSRRERERRRAVAEDEAQPETSTPDDDTGVDAGGVARG